MTCAMAGAIVIRLSVVEHLPAVSRMVLRAPGRAAVSATEIAVNYMSQKV